MPNPLNNTSGTNNPSTKNERTRDGTALFPVRELPSDIIYHLGTVLPPADAAAFALSSKAILEILGSRALKIEQKKDRLDLLKRLEIYFPKHLLCHGCAVFHRRPSPSGKRGLGWILRKRSQPERLCGQHIHRGSQRIGLDFSFAQAQEVMNRHRFGDEYGVPLSTIEQQVRTRGHAVFDSLNVRYDYITLKSISAKIVDDELYVKLDLFRATPVGIHGLPAELTDSSCLDLTPCNVSDRPSTSRFNQYPRKHTRCNRCGSEWRLSTGEQWITGGFGLHPKRGFVRATKWQNLGRCQDPYDPKWRQANGCYAPYMEGSVDIRGKSSSLLYVKYFDDTLSFSRVWQRVSCYLDMLPHA